MRRGATAPPKGVARRARRSMAGPAAVFAMLAATVVLLTATVADAQQGFDFRPQIRDLRNHIVSLRQQLSDLEREVHTGTARRGAAAEEESGQSARNSQRLAELETDIDEAREWRRRVTGRFEELDNMVRRLEGRIERLVVDVDFRLSALEQQQGGASAASAIAPAGDTPSAAPTGQVQASVAPQQETGYEPSAAPRTLGTVPGEQPRNDTPPVGLTPEEQYQSAFSLLEEARHEEAHEAFSRFIDANPTHGLAQNAAYWRAESLYARQMYPEAAKAYALNLRQYPEGRKAPDNMVKLGLALLKLGRAEEACRAFEQLDQAFSDPPLNIRRAEQQGRRQANCP